MYVSGDILFGPRFGIPVGMLSGRIDFLLIWMTRLLSRA
ncbi:hypothetical protein SOHN41_00024 [Shewanella sp. HN-41]|nr:hypothetical protein SOHN41_00024 [Shewanella sp. HN-41]